MHMHEQPDDATIVRATIELAHALGLQVTAEGVETPQAWEMLRSFGAETAQGYLLSRPVPTDELTRLLDHYHASEHGPAPRTLNYA